MGTSRFAVLMLSSLLLVIPSRAARADIAPPGQPPGSNPGPADASTQVRMTAETVLIDVQRDVPASSLGRARVTADFTMRNMGSEPETMKVRFPISANNGAFGYPEIRDVAVLVNGKGARLQRTTGEDPAGGSTSVPWIEFDVTFPTQRDIPVRVTYTLEAAGELPFIWFQYVLSTGAGWYGTIGSADIIVRLPYVANFQNVLIAPADGSIETTPGGTFVDKEARWQFRDFEPTMNGNFEVELVTPAAWENVLNEQENVARSPEDGEAWGRLGKLYKELAFSARGKGFRLWGGRPDRGAQELYRLSVQAYEKAVELKPDDALWHAGFADLLAYHAYFGAFENQETEGEAIQSLKEIRRALALKRDDPQIQEIAAEIVAFFPDGMMPHAGTFEYPWLTATPQVTPSATVAASESEAAATAIHSGPASAPANASAVPARSSTPPASAAPICMGVLPLAAVAAGWRRRRT